MIPDGVGSRESGEKSQHKEKNRYTNIIPCKTYYDTKPCFGYQ